MVRMLNSLEMMSLMALALTAAGSFLAYTPIQADLAVFRAANVGTDPDAMGLLIAADITLTAGLIGGNVIVVALLLLRRSSLFARLCCMLTERNKHVRSADGRQSLESSGTEQHNDRE